ncbi:MAG: tRNA (N(6)-L-threonylcarbamoyladenosine(37)-C(2))-methylthiotransferase [Nanoarchaeota archaeon]|nr:tRNA (N(6)-L-threonylcarbamoyladenosine(37)-C(2))-methylthiotransferase [Nanoarchaeota archaeon]MBU1705012.1 tRNA (N(6)-L-threonylcarbamoyladenosine(37)-C(2))-methylthiotransferase [Nanoarchaeota archaeon]
MTKVYLQTHGCSTNLSESEVMSGLLLKAGFNVTLSPEEADVIIINICTVKGEEVGIRDIRKLSEYKKPLVIAGCVPKYMLKSIREVSGDASIITTHNIENIVEIVEETLNGNSVELMVNKSDIKIGMPRVRRNKVIGIVPISSGCLGDCSYCSVKLIKGALKSYPQDMIVREVLDAVNQGCKEIWITSQDNGAYGMEDNDKSQLPQLMKAILGIRQDFKVRIGMMNPEHLWPVIDEMIEIYKNPRVFKFLHIPVQSGNDEILEKMNRKYNVMQFERIIERFKQAIPNITISTDLIVGFPGETEEQFNDSLNLVRKIMPGVLNISRFQPRPRTRAAHMEGQLHGRDTKERSRLVTDIFQNISRMNNERWLGWKGEVLIDEIGKDNTLIGRNFAYKPVIIRSVAKLGDRVNVTIEDISVFDLRGRVI